MIGLEKLKDIKERTKIANKFLGNGHIKEGIVILEALKNELEEDMRHLEEQIE